MIYVIVGFIILVIIYVLIRFNAFIKLNNKVNEAFATMDVYLKKRWDLIPNLVETVKGYATHEKTTLDEVISARNKAVNASSRHDEIEAAGELTQALGRLFALSEAYPDSVYGKSFSYFCALLSTTSRSSLVKSASLMAPKSPSER